MRIRRQLLLLFVLGGCSWGQTIPPTYFGLHINRQNTPWPQVRFGSLRLWDAGAAQWSQVNPAPGKYDFSDLDEWLQKAKTNNVIDVLYTLSRTPRWAVGSSNRGDANDSSCDYNRVNGPGQCWPPKDLGPDGKGPNQIWKDWVRAIATHVKNLDSSHAKIRYWQIWNEFHRDGSWKGTDEQLVRLAEDARCVITGNGTVRGQPCAEKAIDPDAIIVSPSTGTAPRALAILKRFLDAGGSKAVDVIAIHPYVQFGSCCVNAELVNDRLRNLRGVLSSEDRSKPLWGGEFGWGKTDRNLPDPDAQAAFVARSYLLMWSDGLSRLYWYSYDVKDQGTLWTQEDCGAEGCLTKAGTAYQQVYDWMVGATMNKPCSSSGSVWTCGFSRSGGYQALAVWSASNSDHTYNAPSNFTRYRDLSGKGGKIMGNKVNISVQPILLESGAAQ